MNWKYSCLFSIFFLCLSFSQANLASIEGNSHIRGWVERIKTGNCTRNKDCPIASVIFLPKLYEKYNYQLIWTNPDSVRQLINAIKDSYYDGLTPGDYHLSLIQQLQKTVTRSDPAKQAELDLILTDSLVRLGYHLLFGKVDPESLDSSWNMSRKLELDPILMISSAAIDKGKITGLIDSFRPQAGLYQGLKQALANYLKILAKGGWLQIPAGEKLKSGMTSPRVIIIRQRLVATTDMPAINMESTLYDDDVETGIKKFQLRHGIEVDGIVGKVTLAAMNVPVQVRINQLRVNLDRARWILHDLPKDFVMVDIAGFNVQYIRNGRVIWKTRAMVGTTYRKTPVFRDQIRYIEFNPTWTIPPTILRKDTLPKIKRDPESLRKENMVVLNQQGSSIDPATIDWSQYPGKVFPYLILQQPGPKNALGRVKFMFPNKHNVYLHDTPNKSGFNSAERTFSSGCIRIEDPLYFAELLLSDKPGWDRVKINAAVESRKTTRINLTKPLTVMLLYWTAEVDNEYRVVFNQDIYNRDSAVLAGLNDNFKFRSSKIIK